MAWPPDSPPPTPTEIQAGILDPYLLMDVEPPPEPWLGVIVYLSLALAVATLVAIIIGG